VEDPRESLTAQIALKTDSGRLDARLARFNQDDFYVFTVTPSVPGNYYRARDASLDFSHRSRETESSDLTAATHYRNITHESLVEVLPGEAMRVFHTLGWTPGTARYWPGVVVDQTELRLSLIGKDRIGDGQELAAAATFRQTRLDKTLNQNNYESADTTRFLPCIEALATGDSLRSKCNFAHIRYSDRVIESSDFAATGDYRRIFGLSVQDRLRLTEDLQATIGARLDWNSGVGATVNARAALVYSPASATTLKLMCGEAFRAPTVPELELENNPDLVGNPDVDPERARTLEVAWLQTLGPLQTTVTGYYTRIFDKIQRTRSSNPRGLRPTFENGGDLDLFGIEIETQAKVAIQLFVRASYSHGFRSRQSPKECQGTWPFSASSTVPMVWAWA